MKTLKKIYNEQKEFQLNFFDLEKMTTEKKVEWSKEFILSIHRELGEVLENLPWKPHKKSNYKKINHEELSVELIDCFKYLLNLFILWDISPDEFAKVFFEKSKIVKKKYAERNKNNANQK